MYLIIVYDTDKRNCVKLHKHLKRYLNWNQNSVFEGTVSIAMRTEIIMLLKELSVPESCITIYTIDNEKFVNREEIGNPKGNQSNIL